MLTYLLPTHNRPQRLRQTLDALGSLDAAAHEPIGSAEVSVVDNASSQPFKSPASLANGLPLRVIRLETNIGTAARNIGVNEAPGDWVVMLDDDSYPLDTNHIEVLLNANEDVAAIGADIFLPDSSREAGGLPEVFIGCGVAIRRDAFLEVGGYDPAFDYYAEEYDLCAKLILAGWRIVHDQRFRVQHEKVSGGRDMNRILHRLVRNNGWVMQRYAPSGKELNHGEHGGHGEEIENSRTFHLSEIISRYARIVIKENAACGFASGVAELLQTLENQPRREMPSDLFDRFTGLAHVRSSFTNPRSYGFVETLTAFNSPRRHEGTEEGFLKPKSLCSVSPCLRGEFCSTVALVDEGKNAWAIRQALQEHGVRIVEEESEADALMIGTLSPGPMLDAYERRSALGQRVIMPWVRCGEPQLLLQRKS